MIRAELYRTERRVPVVVNGVPTHVAEWRWRIRAANGKIIADCGEGNGYTRESGALHGLLTVTRTVKVASSPARVSGLYLIDAEGRHVVRFRVIP